MHETITLLKATDFPAIERQTVETLQVNLGYKCNQSCVHCHVNAGPNRWEMMDEQTLDLIPLVLSARGIKTLDLTGGAPELHTQFRRLVRAASRIGVKVIDRCNLTILFEPGQEDLAAFLAEHNVEIVASLPCCSLENVDKQRGDGVFEKSIAALQKLNALGYGRPDSGKVLNLVYNPQGPQLPPSQQALEDNYQAQNLESVMCRSTVSVDWQGFLYDCDFNQQLSLSVPGAQRHLRDLLETDLNGNAICVADHCYGCTAGQGSSCGGAL